MTPERRSSMPGSKLLSNLTAAIRLTFNAFCHSSSVSARSHHWERWTAHAVHQDIDAAPALKKLIHDLLHAPSCSNVRLDKQRWLLASGRRERAVLATEAPPIVSTCGPWPLPCLWSRRSPAPACLGIRSGQRKKGRLLPLCNLQ